MRRAVRAAICAAVAGVVSAGVLSGAGATSARVLPDLVPLPPETVVGPVTAVMGPSPAVDAPVVVDGCYADERVRKGARRCLRFDEAADDDNRVCTLQELRDDELEVLQAEVAC